MAAKKIRISKFNGLGKLKMVLYLLPPLNVIGPGRMLIYRIVGGIQACKMMPRNPNRLLTLERTLRCILSRRQKQRIFTFTPVNHKFALMYYDNVKMSVVVIVPVESGITCVMYEFTLEDLDINRLVYVVGICFIYLCLIIISKIWQTLY